jgi:hypothetical protein
VTPAGEVANDSSLTNKLLDITVGGLHPATDAAFPAASLDAMFAQNGTLSPFYALSHRGGLAGGRANFVQVPGAYGLQFNLVSGSTNATARLGSGRPNGLRAGTYLFGLAPKTWARAGALSNDTAQRSLIVVIRQA